MASAKRKTPDPSIASGQGARHVYDPRVVEASAGKARYDEIEHTRAADAVRRDVAKLARAVAGREVPVIFESGEARTDGDSVFLPDPAMFAVEDPCECSLTKVCPRHIMALIAAHEGGHLAYDSFTPAADGEIQAVSDHLVDAFRGTSASAAADQAAAHMRSKVDDAQQWVTRMRTVAPHKRGGIGSDAITGGALGVGLALSSAWQVMGLPLNAVEDVRINRAVARRHTAHLQRDAAMTYMTITAPMFERVGVIDQACLAAYAAGCGFTSTAEWNLDERVRAWIDSPGTIDRWRERLRSLDTMLDTTMAGIDLMADLVRHGVVDLSGEQSGEGQSSEQSGEGQSSEQSGEGQSSEGGPAPHRSQPYEGAYQSSARLDQGVMAARGGQVEPQDSSTEAMDAARESRAKEDARRDAAKRAGESKAKRQSRDRGSAEAAEQARKEAVEKVAKARAAAEASGKTDGGGKPRSEGSMDPGREKLMGETSVDEDNDAGAGGGWGEPTADLVGKARGNRPGVLVKRPLRPGTTFTEAQIEAGLHHLTWQPSDNIRFPEVGTSWRTEWDTRDAVRAHELEILQRIIRPSVKVLREAFGANVRAGHVRNLRHGDLDGRALAKVPTGGQTIFRKRVRPKRKSYSVLIGCDISGSMSGYENGLCQDAVQHQAELLHRLRIPFSVFAHTGGHNAANVLLGTYRGDLTGWRANRDSPMTAELYAIKGWEDPWDDDHRRLCLSAEATSVNIDAPTFEFYYRQMEQRPETDKIILYYTDGALPAGGDRDEQYRRITDVLRQARLSQQRRRGRIMVVVIGFGQHATGLEDFGLDVIHVDFNDTIETPQGTRMRKAPAETVVEGLAARLIDPEAYRQRQPLSLDAWTRKRQHGEAF